MRVAPSAVTVRRPTDADARVPGITLLFVLPPLAVLAQLVDVVMDLFGNFGERYFAPARIVEIPFRAPLFEGVAARRIEDPWRRRGLRLLGRLDEALLARSNKDGAFSARELRAALSNGQCHRRGVAHIDAIGPFRLRVGASDGGVDTSLGAARDELQDNASTPQQNIGLAIEGDEVHFRPFVESKDRSVRETDGDTRARVCPHPISG